MSGQRLSRLFPDHAPPAEPRAGARGRGPHRRRPPGRRSSAPATSASPSPPARSSASPASSAPAAARSCTASTAACPPQGEIRVDGRPVAIRSPRDARRAGIALLTEDRKRDGLLFNLPVGANITIGNLAGLSRSGVVSGERERSAVLAAMRALNVKAASPQASVAHLSGGNQQKLLFARVLMRAPARPAARRADQGRRRLDPRRDLPPGRRARRQGGGAGRRRLRARGGDRPLRPLLVVSDGRLVDEFRRGEGGEERVLRAVSAAQAARPRRSARRAAP